MPMSIKAMPHQWSDAALRPFTCSHVAKFNGMTINYHELQSGGHTLGNLITACSIIS